MLIDKKQVKKLFDLNQELKTVYKNYLVLVNCDQYDFPIVISNKDGYMMRTGEHYTLLKNANELFDENIILDSNNLFKFISLSKKYIECIKTQNDEIVCQITGTLPEKSLEYSPILGSVCGEIEYGLMKETNPFFHTGIGDIDSFHPMIILSEQNVIDMAKNNYHVLEYGKFSTRITRELIPGLKKTHKVSAMFHEVSDNMFKCIIRAERNTIVTYHVYRCLYI